MSFTIKHLNLEESISILYLLNNYAFRPTPPLPDFDDFAERIRGRNGVNYYAVFEGNQPQAIASAISLKQNLRGKVFPMGGVANVATHPSARRRGYVRALMHHIYKKFSDEETGISCLYPFKESFYQRLGYVTLPQAKTLRFDPKVLSPTLKMKLLGDVQLVSFEEHREEYRQFLEKFQQEIHGMAGFSYQQTNTARESAYWLALAKQEEEIIGVMRYSLKGQSLDQLFSAPDFLCKNSQAKFLLFNWIARHIDQATKVELNLSPAVHGELLFTDIRPQFDGVFVAPMARVVQVTLLNGMPCEEGSISIQIDDSDCQWNNGVWNFSSTGGHLEVKNHTGPDCRLSIQGLTGLIYGVYPPEEINLRGWGEIDEQSRQILQKMFPPAIPFLHAMY